MPANITPQEAVNRFKCKPSECDIVIVVLWSRLGTHLDVTKFRKPNGEPHLSGTEWEFEDALNAQPQPDILAYRRTEELKVGPRGPARDEKLRQYDLVEEFFECFKNPDQSTRSGVTLYKTPEEFKERLANDLKNLVRERLRSAETNASPQAAPAQGGSLHPGSPLLTLRPGRIVYLASMPRLPERYQPRTEALQDLRTRLISSDTKAIGISGLARAAGLLGMGGIGKTVLAAALAQDES